MSCQTCGHPQEGAVQPHHLGCTESSVMRSLREWERNLVESDFSGALCDYPGCSQPKFSASPRAKYCEGHKDPKNRKE